MFPPTAWTLIHDAGSADPGALEVFAREYRAPVVRFLRGRGHSESDAEDLCQDVFLRLLHGKVLSRASAARGRFRSLLLSVVRHTVLDRSRRRRDTPLADLDLELVEEEPDFDREWVVELTHRALSQLREEGSPYYEALRRKIDGEPVERRRLWNARRKLLSAMRREVARTCADLSLLETELEYLERYLGS